MIYLKKTGWSLNDTSSAEKSFSPSPLTTSTELALSFGGGRFGPGREITRFGSSEVLKCLGKLQVTSAPGDFVTENAAHTFEKSGMLLKNKYSNQSRLKLFCYLSFNKYNYSHRENWLSPFKLPLLYKLHLHNLTKINTEHIHINETKYFKYILIKAL